MASLIPIGRTAARVAHTRRGLAAAVLGLGLATGGGALSSGAGATSQPRAPAPTMTDCDNLLRQFDVAWPAQRQSARAASAQHSRDLGEADCRGGRYADGVHHLRRALHDIGVKPVKSVATVPPR